ncbi:MAG: hypothetical protein NC223_02540 [Butyrivibrio sp.]|nr:hypothetical protein [Butyrivibrio sp.]
MEENSNILNGGLADLRVYRKLAEEYDNARVMCGQAASDEKRLEKELALSRKNLKDNIESTVKKRRAEVADKFNGEIGKSQDKLKKVKAKREKAKDKGVKGRIAEETSDLTEQNKELKKSIRRSLREARLPRFCGSGFYFMLYFTKGAGEVFVCALMIILMFLLLPAAVYVALPLEKLPDSWTIPSFAITYFVVILIVFFIYKIIGDLTKHKHGEELKSIRELHDRIVSNKKQIAVIRRSITRDKNEDMYGLGDFDSRIRDIEEEIAQITADKDAALKNFDEASSAEIRAEIESRELPGINELEASYNEMSKHRASLEESVKTLGLKISTEYEAFLGKDFTDIAKLDELIAIMETGRAATVSEAVSVFRTRA